MPFSQTTEKHTEQYWTNHYEKFLKPLIEMHAFEVHRSKALNGDIVKQIITDLIKSPLVVADLTDYNANVLWELGVRQSFKHGTITVAESGTHIPFDLGQKSILFYHEDHIKNSAFVDDFKQAILNLKSANPTPDSSVLETISGRGTIFEIVHLEQNIRRLEGVLRETQWNAHTFQNIMDQVKRNDRIRKKSEGQFQTYTITLAHSCIDLLISERYLSSDSTFYFLAESLSQHISRINGSLSQWPAFPEKVERFLIEEMEPALTKKMNEFKSRTQQERSYLRSKENL
jgi:hypothetical protein